MYRYPRPPIPAGFRPAPLTEQVNAICREDQNANQHLPRYARPGPKGQPARLHEGEVHARLHEFRSITHTLLVLEQLKTEGRLPPELAHL